MNNTYLIDKIIMILAGTAVSVFSIGVNSISIITLLIMIVFAALGYYIGHPNAIFYLYFLTLVGGSLTLAFIFFIPVLAYDIYATKYRMTLFFALLPIILNFPKITWQILLFVLILFFIAICLSSRNMRLEKIEKRYRELRDYGEERKIHLEQKNEELMEKQDYEIHMATLRERNRIAREIHDNVGHMLSRSILQVGALMAINKDDDQKEMLGDLKDTLNTAMTNIRESVHDLHDESIDLNGEITELINQFTLCPVKFEYDLTTDLSRKYKYSILAIVKEALANIMKHSNATHTEIILREHPALYQLLIHDNGTNITKNPDESGIGLQNMKERTENMKGTLHITIDHGYRIFISIPKE